MTRSEQGVSGSLSMKIVRKCEIHDDCTLACPERRVEDLGEVASFTDPKTRVREEREVALRERRERKEALKRQRRERAERTRAGQLPGHLPVSLGEGSDSQEQ
jgi:hypothetical protein